MSDPPPSSAPPVPELPFFHHPDGQRIRIFVEAGGIIHRPRLIRNLKRHDAVICTDPKNAQIILVDPVSWQGKEFIREWGKDQNKVVLDYHWVNSSLDASKPLLETDGWGDCLTRDDGLPILRPTANADEDALAPNPLPTPRETPIEPKLASPKRLKSTDAHRKRSSLDQSLSRINTTPGPAENGAESSSSAHLASHATSFTQLSQPQSQPTPILSPTLTDPTSIFTQQQQTAPTMPFGAPNNMMAGFNMPMMFPQQMLAMFAQQQQAAQSPMSTQPPAVMPQIQENFATALMDIMKMYGAMPGTMPMGQWPMLPGMMSQMQQQMPQTAGSSGSATMVHEDSSGASRRDTESPNLSLPSLGPNSPSVLQPSIKRKRKSDAMDNDSMQDSPESESDDDEEDEDEPPLATLYKKKKRAEEREERGLRQNKKDKDGRKARRTSLQFTAPTRNPHQSSKPASSSDSSNKVFVQPNGKPMQFFVQVDQNNRQEVTRAIKKHGGTITSMIQGANYAVLYTLSNTFKTLLNEATVNKTPAVTHHFVLDSINEGRIPNNLDDYIFSAKNTPTRRKQFTSAAEAEIKRLEKNAKQLERAKREMDMKYNYIARAGTPGSTASPKLASTSSSSTKTVRRASTPSTSSTKISGEKLQQKARSRTSTPVPTVKKPIFPAAGPSSSNSTNMAVKSKPKKSGYYPKETTPPPPDNPQKIAMGYSYTPEERDWMEKYLFVMFKRDPLMSQAAVSKALHNKLPHHTPRSISTFLTSSTFKTEYEEMRKRGGIAHRKEKDRWEAEQERAKPAKAKEEVSSQDETSEKPWPMPGQENDVMNGDVQKDEEMGNQQERAEEKEIEDQVMQDVSSPAKVPEKEGPSQIAAMEVDAVDAAPKEKTEETKPTVQYTPEEESDIQTVVQFFLHGGDDGKSEEAVVWASLARQETRKTATEWEEVFTNHGEEITNRFEKLWALRGATT
ncbi:hypothetical protein NP233_g2283 [Leucocoprinus birnbaumii]|uniref:BRCT domain-containing protein n=1 Tax=Leucocoprinus birnbaumii TaxID=56174 RepID=A0AAD5W0K9_9AGAR|nr:hypothetical protein NP233_g2283 [Leucocoprinus birnbaumii]